MKRLLLPLLMLLLGSKGFSQVFYQEEFDGTVCAAGSGCDPSLVGWTVTNVGANGTDANKFFISCQENGNAAGQCGSGCGNDQSLHVGNVSTSTAAFIFCPTGDCGAAYDDSSPNEITNIRAESPTISCVGQTNIVCTFVYMETGENLDDDGSFWYFDGVTWVMADQIAKSNNAGCSGQGKWTAYSVNLPASANNNPNVKIGFVWKNDGDGVATDPSFAVDDIKLTSNPTSPPVASFTASSVSICEGDCINFTNTSTGAPFTATSWTFSGASTASSTLDSPSNICYPTAGTYDVSLTVTNANGSDTDTQVSFITVNTCTTPPVAAFSANSTTICAGDAVNFTDLSTGAPTTWNWTFTGGTPGTSTSQNPTVTYATAGTYTVTLTVGNANGTNSITQTNYITVTTCSNPVASFTPSATSLCEGDCITINNTSTSASTYGWIFNGGTPSTSTSQNPGVICYSTPGTYTIQLIAANGFGADTISTTITVGTAPTVTASADTTIDLGSTVTLTAVGSGSGNYAWSPTSGLTSPGTATTDATPLGTTAYIVTYSENGCSATDTVVVTVNIIEGIGVPNAFSPNGDQINDELFVMGQGIVKMNFIVYNRYGQKVFETTDQSRGWDGTLDGKKLNGGVFAYYLEYTLISGASGTIKGNVTVVR